ncbi:MAG: SpoIIE family protein phosphatase [Spirochaetales bacterium]|nr:SpoIIE family protein phosphatase [Spirochaetales bacterium]
MDKNKKIILVDDEESLVSTLAFLLRKNGYNVDYFVDGFEAYMRIKELVESNQTPDLLITDLEMPGLKGMNLIDYIGSLAFHLPILVITGYGDKKTVVDLLRKGCMDYIDKPFDDKTFIKSVNDIFEKEKQRNLEHVDIKIKLLRELEQYKKENKELRIQINAAVDSYQNLITMNEIPENLPLAYRSMPYCNLGGDFFDIRKTEVGYDVLFADVAGHDISACFNTVIIKGSFYEHRETDCKGESYFEMLNNQLENNFPDTRMVTAVFVSLNFKEMYTDFIVAGHPLPFIVSENNVEQLSIRNTVLGFMKGIKFVKERVKVKQGMRIILYTDGIVNAQGRNGDGIYYMGKPGILKSILRHKDKTLSNLIENIWADTLDFCDQKPNDDMLLLGIEIPVNISDHQFAVQSGGEEKYV